MDDMGLTTTVPEVSGESRQEYLCVCGGGQLGMVGETGVTERWGLSI